MGMDWIPNLTRIPDIQQGIRSMVSGQISELLKDTEYLIARIQNLIYDRIL